MEARVSQVQVAIAKCLAQVGTALQAAVACGFDKFDTNSWLLRNEMESGSSIGESVIVESKYAMSGFWFHIACNRFGLSQCGRSLPTYLVAAGTHGLDT